MDERDRDLIKQINRDRKEAHRKFTQLGSKVYGAFLDLERATFADGHLKKLHKESYCICQLPNIESFAVIC